MTGLISCVAWVKRGVAARHPEKYNLDEKELQRVSALARIEFEDARVELERAAGAAAKQMEEEDEENEDELELDHDAGGAEGEEDDWVDEEDELMDEDEKPKAKKGNDDLAQYNLHDYDNEPDNIASGPFSNIKSLTYYKNDDEDPHITLKEDDEAIEREELEIYPTDNMLVAARTEDEISQLEIYVYDESEGNLYVHHDIMLPSFPLCLEWLDFPPCKGSTTQENEDNAGSMSVDDSPATAAFGNYIAVGTFEPEIEIWSLETVDALYPDSILGRPDKSAPTLVPLGTGKKKRKKFKAPAPNAQYHVDAVLSLAWNRTHRHWLASASADRTVKVWDLTRDPTGAGTDGHVSGALRSFDVHKDKVQAVQWNTHEPTVLLTGSYDRTVRTFDTRASGPGAAGVGAVVGADVECVRWDIWDHYSFYASLENGIVLNFDTRALPSDLNLPSPSRFMLAAHDGAASALDVNPHIRGCLATGGTDKMVKVWNVTDKSNGKKDVSLVTSRDLGVGKVFSVTFSPDDPLTVAAAGSKGKLQIWEVGTNAGARKAFTQKLEQAGREVKEKRTGGVVSVISDDEGLSDDDG